MTTPQPGSVCELTWFPPDGGRFGLDAYADEVGTVTELKWFEGDGEHYHSWPALVEQVTVLGDGSQATARLRVMPSCHWPRGDPYPDELDQLFCGQCETLCVPGRSCACCYAECW